MTLDEAKVYYSKLAQDAGLDESSRAAVLQALGNEKFAKALVDDHLRHDEFSRLADKVRARETELGDWKKKADAAYEQAENAYRQNIAGIERLKRYEATYGELNADSTAGDKSDASTGTGLTMAQVERLLEERFKVHNAAYVAFTKSAVRVGHDHASRFKEPLDVDALEKFALEKGLPLEIAYREFIAPRVEAQKTAEWEVKVKTAREEGARDALSKAHIPLDTGPKEPHPFFGAKPVEKGTSALQQEQVSKSAFLEGWNEAAQRLAGQQ